MIVEHGKKLTTTRFNVETQTELTHRCAVRKTEEKRKKERNFSNVNLNGNVESCRAAGIYWRACRLLGRRFQVVILSTTTCFNFLSRATSHFFLFNSIYVPFGDIFEMMLSMKVDVDCLAIYAFSFFSSFVTFATETFFLPPTILPTHVK